MGKSTLISLIRSLYEVPIWDADQCVRDMLQKDKAIIQRVAALFPDTLENGCINRSILKKNVFANERNLIQLERIVHPALKIHRERFIKNQRRLGQAVCILDIPLLFETGADVECDYIVVVSAPAFLQEQRIRKRFGGQVDVKAVLGRQLPDQEKRKRADCVLYSSGGKRAILEQWLKFIRKIT